MNNQNSPNPESGFAFSRFYLMMVLLFIEVIPVAEGAQRRKDLPDRGKELIVRLYQISFPPLTLLMAYPKIVKLVTAAMLAHHCWSGW